MVLSTSSSNIELYQDNTRSYVKVGYGAGKITVSSQEIIGAPNTIDNTIVFPAGTTNVINMGDGVVKMLKNIDTNSTNDFAVNKKYVDDSFKGSPNVTVFKLNGSTYDLKKNSTFYTATTGSSDNK